ncbi:Ras-related protein-like protein [Hapsidospora chrysogenum ATCC 11550]|uniref:Ras-related protein-like protein n=1 Tax=Hapsidospora chrysogenum (strain ATCC 11550 / CBS 779.69 / DSM 880 / IAM 14645 / JCM 23072 / IMI 49137) TaxID=857340 RepID=A0A086T069_HAPC1|nr:Ras-related protein-like protein [Hapsidospora chrysogenum ATCC 11550]
MPQSTHAGAAQFVHNEWIESYDPTIEDSYRTQLQVDCSFRVSSLNVVHSLDTAGTEQFGRQMGTPNLYKSGYTNAPPVAMRDLYMKTGQGFLLVFSITSASSLDELASLRDEIIRIKDDENVPIVIVGNKADLEDGRAIPRARAFSISQRWAAPYYESSARTRTNVDEVFIDLCRQMLRKDDDYGGADDNDDYKYDSVGGPQKKRRRRRLREHSNPRCVIL